VRHRLRNVSLGFLDDAPTKLEFTADVQARRAAVFEAISADPSSWTWFPGLARGHYEGPGPHGVGSVREVRMAGTGYRETILAWDEPARWAYRVDASSVPVGRALVEDWLLEDRGDCTTVRWVFAIEPSSLFRLGLPLAPLVMGRLFRRAMANLSLTLTEPAVSRP
jgi:hypothetical protein